MEASLNAARASFPRIAAVQGVEVGIFSSINFRESNIIFHIATSRDSSTMPPFSRPDVIGISPPSGVQQMSPCQPRRMTAVTKCFLRPCQESAGAERQPAWSKGESSHSGDGSGFAEPKDFRGSRSGSSIRNAERFCISRASRPCFSL